MEHETNPARSDGKLVANPHRQLPVHPGLGKPFLAFLYGSLAVSLVGLVALAYLGVITALAA